MTATMTEPQAGSDTGNIQTTATFDPKTNEWVLNGQKIFCTSGKLALQESDGLVVVWATIDKKAGRAGMKPFVVEAGTPGVIGNDEDHGDELRPIEFDRIAGHKPFDYRQDWFIDMLADIGQGRPERQHPGGQ